MILRRDVVHSIETLELVFLHIGWRMLQADSPLRKCRLRWTLAANFATRLGRMPPCRLLLSSNRPRHRTLSDSSPRLVTSS